MKQKLMALGQKLTDLINLKLQDQNLSQDDYLMILEKIELITVKEIKTLRNEIVEVETKKTVEAKDEN